MWTWIRMALYLVLGIVSIWYGFFVRAVGSGNKFYRVWFLVGCIFLLLIPAAYFHLWKSVPRAVRVIVIVLLSIGLLVYILLLARIATKFDAESGEAEYLIVLGAQIHESGPSLVLLYRLETAVTYLNEHPGVTCIVSGGQGDNEPVTEAEGMRDYLVAHGIDESRIVLEDRSADTSENLKNCLALLPSADVKVGIVTNNFHMYRALGIAEACGYKNVCGVPAPSKKAYLLHNITRECVGVLKDLLFGNMRLY